MLIWKHKLNKKTSFFHSLHMKFENATAKDLRPPDNWLANSMWSDLTSPGEHRKRYRTPAFMSMFDKPEWKEGSIWDLQGPVLKKLGRHTSSANDTTVPDGPRFHRMLLVAATNSAIFFSCNTKKKSRWNVCCRGSKGQNGKWIEKIQS